MKQEQAQRRWLDDPRNVQVGTMEARADLERILSDTRSTQLLDGIWKVRIVEEEEANFDFIYESSYHPGFSDVEVPSCLMVRTAAEQRLAAALEEQPGLFFWDGLETVEDGHAPARQLQAQYLLDFDLDPLLEKEAVRLVFDGVSSAMYVWLNGQFVGYAAGSFTRRAFDVSSMLQDKNNRLALLVFSHSSADWLEQHRPDLQWGIWQSVRLEGHKKAWIRDLKVTTDLRQTNAHLLGLIRVQIQDEYASVFGIRLFAPDGRRLFFQKNGDRDLRFELENPSLWSAENPALYTLEIDVYDPFQELAETVIQTIGIRKIAVENGTLLLNGRRLMLHGVNYAPAVQEDGRPVSEENLLRDLLLMKRSHINAVRTHGHPLPDLFYHLCDEMGLYVMDEAAVDCRKTIRSVSGKLLTDPLPDSRLEWRRALIDRAESMYERHKNHPSILFWSLGRHSGYGDDLLEEAAWLRLKDPHRILHYEADLEHPDVLQYTECSDLFSCSWASSETLTDILQDAPSRPLINGVYMDMKGNAGGGLYRYTQLEQYAGYQGGFLERLPRAAGTSQDQAQSALLSEIRHLFSPVRILPDETGVQILNNRLFTDTSDLEFYYIQKVENVVIETGKLDVALDPQTYAHFSIPWKDTRAESVQTVYAFQKPQSPPLPNLHPVGFGQRVQGKIEYFYTSPDRLVTTRGRGRTSFTFKNKKTRMVFDRRGLISLEHEGEEWLHSLPHPIFTHPYTEREKKAGFDLNSAFWYGASLFQNVRDYRETIDPDGHYATLSYEYQLPFPYPSSASCTITYTIAPPGVLGIDITLDASRSMPDLAVFGMEFAFLPTCSRFLYYGYGPYENYRDRQEGSRLDVFESSARGSLSFAGSLQECGNHTGVRWLELLNPNGDGLRISKIGRPFEACVLPYSFEELERTKTLSKLPPSQATWVRIAGDHKAIGGDGKSEGADENGRDAGGLPARNSRRLSFFLSFPAADHPASRHLSQVEPGSRVLNPKKDRAPGDPADEAGDDEAFSDKDFVPTSGEAASSLASSQEGMEPLRFDDTMKKTFFEKSGPEFPFNADIESVEAVFKPGQEPDRDSLSSRSEEEQKNSDLFAQSFAASPDQSESEKRLHKENGASGQEESREDGEETASLSETSDTKDSFEK